MKKLSASHNSFEISVRAQSSKQSSLDFLKKEWAFFSKLHNFSFSSIKMPKRIFYYNVLRSPHVNKKSREQFQLSSYKRLLDIYSSSSKTIDALMKLELPSGVEVEIKV